MFCHMFPVAGQCLAGFSTSPAVCLFVYIHYDTLFKSSNRDSSHWYCILTTLSFCHDVEAPPDGELQYGDQPPTWFTWPHARQIFFSCWKWKPLSEEDGFVFIHEAAKKSVSCTHVNIWIAKIMDDVTNMSWTEWKTECQWLMALAYNSISELTAVTIWQE